MSESTGAGPGGRQVSSILLIAAAIAAAGVLWYTRSAGDGTHAVELGSIVQPGAASGYNVIMVTLDTTRADRLGCYGYEDLQTPAIDSLAARGVRFDHAVTSVPVTLPAHATIFTGLYPYHHGVHNNGSYEVTEDQVTLAEILKDNGYDTAAFVSAFVLDERFGLAQGFDVYDFEISEEGQLSPTSLASERGANYVTDAALRWLRQRQKSGAEAPFFIWVHYYDPHAPYESPLSESPRFRGSDRSTAYDAEIAFVDLHLKRLLDKLVEQGLQQRTLVVMVTDHGEALGEHGEQEHGGFLYEASMRVALVFSCPGLFTQAYRVSDRLVGTVDIVPTVAEFLGIPLSKPVDGQGLLTAAADPDRALYMETLYTQQMMGCAALYGLRRLHDKFILAPRPEYYDLADDPGELQNRFGDSDPAMQELQERLADVLGAETDTTQAARIITQEEIDRLAALGYVNVSGAGPSGQLPDPKDIVPMLAELGLAKKLMAESRFDEALEVAREIAARAEGVAPPVFLIADVYVEQGRRDKAIPVLDTFAQENPLLVEAWMRLASELFKLGRYTEMENALQAAALADRRCGAVHMLRGDWLVEQKRYPEAIREYRKGLEMDADRLGPMGRDKLNRALILAGEVTD
jgi:arylsulfatase A-like enzyme/predicted negative regulator of RcsB-dependent stress response